ncbi:YhcB family protein [Geoalkalibacter sp.]|uniref:YhcB family protein n=1 Tax=Geoalkalibacter sp. TaxID=3041440 RepID=UPI00272EBECD|nr:DUF1043 family protein [Geoalkalibacter sp.]
MQTWILIVAIALLVGVLGFFFGVIMGGRSRRVKALEEELEARKKELAEYRSEVTRHFDKAGALFATLTGSYRNLYHHLAEGCERLADTPFSKQFPGAPMILEGGGSPSDEDATQKPEAPPAAGVAAEVPAEDSEEAVFGAVEGGQEQGPPRA